MKKAMVFIDGSNFYHGMKDQNIPPIDFRKFIKKITQDYQLTKTKYYNAPIKQEENPEGYKQQQKFFNYLRSIPRFELILGRLAKRSFKIPEGIYERIKDIHPERQFVFYEEKKVDVNLAIDIVHQATLNIYDVAMIVSGDGDFEPAVEMAQELGKEIINVWFEKGHYLKNSCDNYIPLTKEYVKDCQYRKTQG